jgi:hypothetical protein
MTNLTDREREAIVSYLFDSETAFLVENLMALMPEDELKALGQRLTDYDDEEEKK